MAWSFMLVIICFKSEFERNDILQVFFFVINCKIVLRLMKCFISQDMKQVEYMYASQIPKIKEIIEMFSKSVEILRTLEGPQNQVFEKKISFV